MRKIFTKIGLLLICFTLIIISQGCSEKIENNEQEEVTTGKSLTKEDALWSFKTGSMINSNPISYKNNVIFGSNDGFLYSVNTETKAENWKYKSEGPISNTPILYNDIVIFSTFRNCYALDANSGKELWKFTTTVIATKNLSGWDYHSPSPIIYKDNVIFTVQSGYIYGLDIKTGNKTFEFKAQDGSDIIATPSIKDNILCFGDVQYNLFAFDLDSKKIIWKKSIGTNSSDPVDVVHAVLIHEDTVIFSGRDARVSAYNLKDGSSKWTHKSESGSWFTGDMLVLNNIVYVPGSDNLKITLLDITNGDDVGLIGAKSNIFSKPTIIDNIIYYTDGNAYNFNTGHLMAYDLEKKEKLFTVSMDGAVYSSPLVLNNVVYFGGRDGVLYAFKSKVE